MLAVTFMLGRQQYGLPVEDVMEIVLRPALVELAGAPPFLPGLLNLRGSFIPVIDCRSLLGEPPQEELNSHIVIAGRQRPEIGLLVDQVQNVGPYGAEQITSLNPATTAPYLKSVINAETGTVLLFDLPELTRLAPVIQLEDIAT